MMKIFALVVLVATASALPSTVPEFSQEPSSVTHPGSAEQAQATITELLQDGKDDGACADLADSLIKEVEDTVQASQDVLDGLDTGADCYKEGQAAVDAAEGALTSAKTDKDNADDALATAMSAMVQFGPKPLSSLNPGQCDIFFSDPAYTNAHAAAEAAQNAATQAAAAVVAAEKGVDDARAAQNKLINDCYCKVKGAYELAWTAANKNNDDHVSAFTKGKHMKCVLAGTPANSCSVGDVPKVTAITLVEGADHAQCDGEYNPAQGRCASGYEQVGTGTTNNDVSGVCMGQSCAQTNGQCASKCADTPGCVSYMIGPNAQNGHCAGLCEICNQEEPNNSWGTNLFFCKKATPKPTPVPTPQPTPVPTPQPTPNPTAPANSPGCSHTVGNYCESHYKVTTCPSHYSRILSQSDCSNGFSAVRGMSKNPTVSCWGGHPKGCFTHGTSSPSSLLFNTCGKTSGSTYSDTKTLCRKNRL